VAKRVAVPTPTSQPGLPGSDDLLRTKSEAPIRWQCSVCDDTGVINNWEDSPFDLRRRGLTLAEPTNNIVITNQIAAALRDQQLLDPDCQRLVFRIRAQHHGAVLSTTDEDLDELIGVAAAEANHEPNRRRQQRLNAAFDALNNAAADGR